MSSDVVGRELELASVRDFLGSVSGGATALVLEGEAGMGKTTLWAAGVAEAEALGLRVLQSRPAESETALSFSGVGDLLDAVLDEALAPLPDPQRRALARALVLEEDDGSALDERAVGVAVLGALRSLAETTPVLVAVDDVQWLDAASSAALGYAARRLRAERVGVLIARRVPLESTLLAELSRSLPSERFTNVEVGPVDLSALHHVVHDHLGVTLPRPLLAEVHVASGGNPFYALEIVRTLQRKGISIEAGQPLPVPESLHELVHGRLLALPAESRDYLLAAAAHAHPTTGLTEAASGVGRSAGLAPALEARIVELEGDRIRFAHPLLAAGAYQAADPVRRAEVHARLAELLEDPEARAWQLAASVEDTDEAVALALESAALHARARGAPRPAALLLDRARELTPADLSDEALRRAVDAAYLHYESGDSPRAEAQLRDVIPKLVFGRNRARAVMRLARVRAYEALGEAAELFLQAVAEAEGAGRSLLWRTKVSPPVSGGSMSASTRRSRTLTSLRSSRSSSATTAWRVRRSARGRWRSSFSDARARLRHRRGLSRFSPLPRTTACLRSRGSPPPSTWVGRGRSSAHVTSWSRCCDGRVSSATRAHPLSCSPI